VQPYDTNDSLRDLVGGTMEAYAWPILPPPCSAATSKDARM
jgi:hypothetical protein